MTQPDWVISGYAKRAVKTCGAPIGHPQPVRYIDCECGHVLPMPHGVESMQCQCGICYDERGWIYHRPAHA